jgi:four helix bundle protein
MFGGHFKVCDGVPKWKTQCIRRDEKGESEMRGVIDLEVYQLAEAVSDLVWTDYDAWSRKVQRTIGYQIIDASDSIAANISEGYGRYTSADKSRFYLYARGSLEETKCWLRKLIRRRVINRARQQDYGELINALGPKLNGFINKTRASSK